VKTHIWIVFLCLIFFNKVSSQNQILTDYLQHFSSIEIGDSIRYSRKTTNYYSFFKGKKDSIFISFDVTYFDEVIVLNKQDRNGYLSISLEGELLINYQITCGKVEGLGYMIHPDLLSTKYFSPYCQGMFKNNQLHGIVTFYDNKGIIKSIVKYKGGRYSKHIYKRGIPNPKKLKKSPLDLGATKK